MDEHTPESWWVFRFKDGHVDIAQQYTSEKMQRQIAAHGPLIGIAPA